MTKSEYAEKLEAFYAAIAAATAAKAAAIATYRGLARDLTRLHNERAQGMHLRPGFEDEQAAASAAEGVAYEAWISADETLRAQQWARPCVRCGADSSPVGYCSTKCWDEDMAASAYL